MYFRGSNDILVILSVGIQWEDLWNSYIKKSFEIHGFGLLKSWMDLTQIQILMILSHPNKEFGFQLSNPNPWAQIHPIQTDHKGCSVLFPPTPTTQILIRLKSKSEILNECPF